MSQCLTQGQEHGRCLESMCWLNKYINERASDIMIEISALTGEMRRKDAPFLLQYFMRQWNLLLVDSWVPPINSTYSYEQG